MVTTNEVTAEVVYVDHEREVAVLRLPGHHTTLGASTVILPTGLLPLNLCIGPVTLTIVSTQD